MHEEMSPLKDQKHMSSAGEMSEANTHDVPIVSMNRHCSETATRLLQNRKISSTISERLYSKKK